MFEAFEQQREALRAAGLAEQDLPFSFYQPDFRTGVLLLHGSGATPCNHRAMGQHLFGYGYSVLAPILAGHAEPGRLYAGEIGWQDCLQGAEADLEALAARVERVFVLGSSFGGSLAYVLAAARPDLIDGIIAVSAPAMASERWQPSEPWPRQVRAAIEAADRHLPQVEVPSLIMHGYDDPSVRVRNALHAYERIPALRKKLVLYDGIGHSLGFGFNTPEVSEDVHRFIQASFPPRRVTFVVPDRGQLSLAVAGEFNGWDGTSLAMTRRDGAWVLELELQPGVYQYKLVLDGRHWILDPDADTVPTPHGELNSLLRVN